MIQFLGMGSMVARERFHMEVSKRGILVPSSQVIKMVSSSLMNIKLVRMSHFMRLSSCVGTIRNVHSHSRL